MICYERVCRGGNCVTAYARQRNSATAPEGSDIGASMLTPLLVPLVAVFAPSRPLSPSFGQSLEPRRCDPNQIGEVGQIQSNHKPPL